MNKTVKFIDLFAGTGGFSEGFLQAKHTFSVNYLRNTFHPSF